MMKKRPANESTISTPEIEYVPCDYCGSSDHKMLYEAADWPGLALPPQCALVKCRQCGLMYLNPRPSLRSISDYYPDTYLPFRTAIEDERSPVMRWMRGRKMTQRRKAIQKYSRLDRGRILDVGCSTGIFLHAMDQSGWETAGVELSPSAAEYARNRFGLEVFTGTLGEADYPDNHFDVISYWDVLEHTFSPKAELLECRRVLREGGLLAINIPNWDSPDRKLFGPDWIGLDPPRHLYVFTRQTLTLFLKMAGFTPLHWVCIMPSYFSFIISFERWLRGNVPALAEPLNRFLNFPGVRFVFEPYFSVANLLKLGGVITVFAQKSTGDTS